MVSSYALVLSFLSDILFTANELKEKETEKVSL